MINRNENSYIIDNFEDVKDYLNFVLLKEKKANDIIHVKSKLTAERNPAYILAEPMRPYRIKSNEVTVWNSMLDKIMEYAEELPGPDYIDAQALERMLLKLFGRKCDIERHERMCNISNKVQEKRQTVNNFYEGSQNIDRLDNQMNMHSYARR